MPHHLKELFDKEVLQRKEVTAEGLTALAETQAGDKLYQLLNKLKPEGAISSSAENLLRANEHH